MSPQWTDRQRRLEEAIKGGETLSPGIWRTLQQDEQVLILLMADPTKVTPTTPGNVEFGWVLYYLNNKAWTWLKDALRDLGMPASKITHAMWQAWWTIWESKGVVMGDGSWLDTAKYAVLDLGVETGGTGLGWAEAAIDYFLIQLNIITLANFAHTPAVITIDPNTHPTLKIAMMGDWGTGSYKDGNLSNSPSQLVAAQIANQNPDIVVHLGDVYYSGTATEEQNNLLNCWPKGTLGNFTLNSNHEMYDGGNAYYSTVLTHSLFSAQNGTSYFAINYGDWVILGLDSAYNATSFYLDGRIDDAYQPGFVNPLVQGKNTFLMTHHNPMDIVGATLNTLWTDVVQGCFGGTQPDVWYWGHVHNGVVYNGSAPTGQTASRCLGNAAIPIGDGYWLDSASGVEYYTHTPLGDTDPNNALRVKNGFAIVEVSSSGIQETFYDQDGNVGWQS